jgi:PAS domain-containing protein
MALQRARESVTSAELVRQFGRWQDQAVAAPVLVTHHGRDRLVLLSAPHYRQLLDGVSGWSEDSTASRADEPTREVMDHVAQGFIAFSRTMKVVAINRAACCFLKTEREAVLGRCLDERLPGIEETLGYAGLVRAAESGCVATLEMPSFAYEGRWLLFQTFPYGEGAACLFRDITDELEARTLADAKTATLAALAVHGGIGRAKLSPRGTFTDVDDAFAGLVGFTPDGIARARLTDILATRWRAATADAVEAVLEGGSPRQLDVELLTKGGLGREVRIGLAPLRRQNAPNGAVVVMTDRGGCSAVSDERPAMKRDGR